MATPGQVANDLIVQATRLQGTGNDHLVASLRRGAATIRQQTAVIAALEAAAEAEARKYEAYVYGDDLHG